MPKKEIIRQADNAVIAKPCFVADNFLDRFLGLMGEESLSAGSGLLITSCNSVHTFFMRFPIDLVYLNSKGTVLSVNKNMKPWRVGFPVFGACSVFELPAGMAG